MDGDQQTSLHINVRLNSLFRQHMDIRPARIILAAFHQRKIEGSMGTSDLGKMRTIPAVSAEEDLGLLPLNNPGAPQRGVAVQQTPPREMPRRSACEGYPLIGKRISPVLLADLLCGHPQRRR